MGNKQNRTVIPVNISSGVLVNTDNNSTSMVNSKTKPIHQPQHQHTQPQSTVIMVKPKEKQ
jgi:hypothetical protein